MLGRVGSLWPLVNLAVQFVRAGFPGASEVTLWAGLGSLLPLGSLRCVSELDCGLWELCGRRLGRDGGLWDLWVVSLGWAGFLCPLGSLSGQE